MKAAGTMEEGKGDQRQKYRHKLGRNNREKICQEKKNGAEERDCQLSPAEFMQRYSKKV